MTKHNVFVAGGTGYLGARLIAELLQRGHEVRALARAGSEQKLLSGCTPIIGNALDKNSYTNAIHPADTFVHLVGVSHPNPSKAEQFRMYWLFERLPATRETTQRLGLVKLPQMLRALINAVENPVQGMRVWTVPQIRKLILEHW